MVMTLFLTLNSPGTILFERMFKFFEKSPMRERREFKMYDFLSFLMVLIFFENFKKFLRARMIIYQKCPFNGQLSLAGYG